MRVLVAGLGFDPVMAQLTATAIIAGVLFALGLRFLGRRARAATADKAASAVEARMGWTLCAWMGAGVGALTLAAMLLWRLVEAGAVTWQTGLFLCALMILAVLAQNPIVSAYRAALRERDEQDQRG